MRLTGMVALVTGGSSGIGAATARALAGAGARPLIAGRDPARLQAIADQTGGIALAGDLAAPGGPAGLAAAAQRAAATLPGPPGDAAAGIDILVNNAGLGWAGPIGDITTEKIAELVAVNLTAPMQLTRLLIPAMMARGRGRVVFVSSIAGATGVRGEAVYAATKAGLGLFAESLAYELDGHGVRVSVIVPGVIDTPFFDRRGHPYGRKRPGPQPPERVAQAIVSGLERDREVSYVPRWMRLPAWLHGAAPGTFRALAARFGDPG
ncbi:MAG TPA: SDR family NAD(P)-dependent oxidoreductase [Streptosporangiaceae bacterium]|nr:SDR family NAD(P)-dependent oxidoreductase [Streptosporangiaceae bacterium]